MLHQQQDAQDPDQLERDWQEKLTQAADDRKRFEPTWHEALAFAAGKQWLMWSLDERQMVMPRDLHGNAHELYTADRITEYRMTVLGEMSADDERPELLLVRDDEWSEETQQALNRAVEHGWDHEWDGDRALARARQLLVDLGTAGIRCRFDPTKGPVLDDNVPHFQGRPVADPNQAMQLMEQGAPLEFKPVREGRIVWDTLSPFNMLVPTGVVHEDDMPWEAIVKPVLLEDVQGHPLYGQNAAELVEDTDIGSLLGLDSKSETSHSIGVDTNHVGSDGSHRHLKGHVWLTIVYERPCARYPNGRQLVFGGSKRKLLHIEQRLPVRSPNGEYRSGVEYLHWWRVTGRFWSRGLVEAMEDAQRRINRRTTQNAKIIDRGMPKVFVEEGSPVNMPRGLPLELVELKSKTAEPKFFNGIGPGPWMNESIEQGDGDLAHATGVYGPSRGENPPNVDTYSQLALIAENDQTKREPIYRDHKTTVVRLVEDSVSMIRQYWGPEKKVLVSEDDENQIGSMVFNAAEIPDFYVVKVAKGAARPRSQGAMLQLVTDLKTAAVEAQVFMGPEWMSWYRESLEAGQPLDFPEVPGSAQEEIAELENHSMLNGQPMEPAYWDLPEVHIPIHRAAQDQARLSGDMEAVVALEQHIQAHMQAAAAAAAMVADAGGGVPDPEQGPVDPAVQQEQQQPPAPTGAPAEQTAPSAQQGG